MIYLHQVFTFDPQATNVNTKAGEAIYLQSGVCQDIAHVMIGIQLHMLG